MHHGLRSESTSARRPGVAVFRFVTLAPGVASLLVVGAASLTAQTGARLAMAQARAFAPPQAVGFHHIRAAMESRGGSYHVEQIRRLKPGRMAATAPTRSLGPFHSGFVGTRERLVFRGADPRTETPARFKLEFRGLEGRRLTASQSSLAAAEHKRRAAFNFRYQGFRVVDSARAAEVYQLIFLATGTRQIKEGPRTIYRLAVIPKNWDRTAWLLELDTGTGYPLYSGEYAVSAAGVALVSELVVTSFVPGARVPDANHPSWWKPTMGVAIMATGEAALKMALPKSKRHVLPDKAELPGGYRLERIEVHTDPYTVGRKKALLAYSDGVDHLFVQQKGVKLAPRGADDVINYLSGEGVTQCLFTHRGVEFHVVGRTNGDAVRRFSSAVYRQAIRVLN